MSNNQYIIGVFDDEDQLIEAIEKAKEANVNITEAYTPFPVHEVLHLLDRKSNIPTVAYFYGLTGATSILSFLYWTSVVDWPIRYGGKPFNSIPSFIIITIIFTILFVTITSLITFSVRSKLYPGKPADIIDHRATDDKFILVLNKNDNSEKLVEINSILSLAGASEIYEQE